MSKYGNQYFSMSVMNSCSQSAPVPKALLTTRTRQVPPDWASTTNSLTNGVTLSAVWPVRVAHSGSAYSRR